MNGMVLPLSVSALAFCLTRMAAQKSLQRRKQVESRIKELGNGTEAVKKVRKPLFKKKSVKGMAAGTKKKLEKLETELYDSGVKIPADQFMLIWLCAAFCLPLLLLMLGIDAMACSLIAAIAAFGPIAYIKLRKKKRKQQLESQLVEAISVLCNALKAGHSFQSAMNTICSEMDGPISDEFGRVFRETQHGMTMADSMDSMVERTGSEDLEMLCTAILIQREIGGNLAEVLENISQTIQRRLSLKAEIKTRTASGRLSGYIVGALPIFLLVAMSVINPDYTSMLFVTDFGHVLLIIGGVMEIIGFMVISKIVAVKY